MTSGNVANVAKTNFLDQTWQFYRFQKLLTTVANKNESVSAINDVKNIADEMAKILELKHVLAIISTTIKVDLYL